VLKYADPIEVRDILNNVLDQSSGGGGGGGGGQGNQNSLTSLSGIYRFEAFSDKNALLVVCKTEESFAFLDSIIEEIDQPAAAGLPFVIELENADAVRLAEELNVLLAERGSGSGLTRPDEGLSGQPADTELEQAGTGREVTEGGEITFPWQSGGRQNADNADQSPESSLIGKVRIVPIIRRNALSILCPASLEQPIRDLVMAFDQPSRQVMITATIVEVRLGDDFSLGVRIGNDDIASSSLADNRVAGGVTGAFNMAEFLGGVFSTSTLDIGTSVNVVIQALAELTDVRILQEPRIFTSDNEEAVFFDGKDVPTLTDTQLLETGVQNQSYEYRSVGVQLNVRPRITSDGDVDLEVNLTLADLSTDKEFGASIINRRQTTSQVIVENRQTIVISGIITELESETNRKIPLLGDIPFLGEFFNSNEDVKERKELLAFITPTVVHSPDDNYDNYNKIFLERLELLSRPLDNAFKDQMKEARFDEISPFDDSQIPITERRLRILEQEGIIELDEPDLPLPPVIPDDQDSDSQTKSDTSTGRELDQDDWEDLLEPKTESSSGE
jgi:type II secretion system protein D